MAQITLTEITRQLGGFRKVRNLASPRSWRDVPNQYELSFENGRVFQSYETIIAVRLNGQLYLTSSHDCSNTTSKYATEWTGYNTRERRDGLKSGKFIEITDD